MNAQTRPARLQDGARIGVVSPAYWLEDERLRHAVGVFERLGYELVCGDSTRLRDDKFAGSPVARATDIMAMFGDPSIDAIICARGGYGANRVLPLLDYDVIRSNPKIFVGYSDATGLLASMARQAGLVTFHGPMLSTFDQQALPWNIETLQRVLSGEPNVTVRSPPACPARTLRPGTATGPLWGGNLVLLIERLGTPDQLDLDGAILFIEDVGEYLYKLDRMLLHLKRSGSLDAIAGLVVGEMVDMEDTDEPFGKTVDEIVLDVCGEFEVPVVSNFPCGHGACQATLPVSHEVVLDASTEAPFILIPEPPVT
ncbi:MAG: LD-carboxypeptidase [Woeseiaceae bacterium]